MKIEDYHRTPAHQYTVHELERWRRKIIERPLGIYINQTFNWVESGRGFSDKKKAATAALIVVGLIASFGTLYVVYYVPRKMDDFLRNFKDGAKSIWHKSFRSK